MSGNSLGSTGIALYADTATFQSDMGKAAATAEREMRRIQRESSMASAIVNELGRRMNATSNTAEQAFARQEAATRRATAQVLDMGRAHARAAQQAQQLNYQITDIATGLATGQNPFYVLMQQGGQLRDQFGSIGAAAVGLARGVFSLVSPLGLAAAAAGGVGYAMYLGAKESEEFQRQIALTGNYAALTEAKLRSLATVASERTGRTLSSSIESASALAGTGLFNPDTLQAATRAMTAYQRLSGETADEALKHFSSIANGAAKWAADESRSLHFLTVERYKQIKSLEDQGKQSDAMLLALKTMSTELESRATPQVWGLAKAWKTVGEAADWAKRTIMDWGKPETMADALETAQKRLADLTKPDVAQRLVNLDAKWGRAGAPAGSSTRMAIDKWRADVEAARAQVRELQNMQAREESAAQAKSAQMAKEQNAIQQLTNPPKGAPTDHYGQLTTSIQQYLEVSQQMIATEGKLSESDRWAIEMKAKLADKTLNLTDAQKKFLQAYIQGAAEMRKQADILAAHDYITDAETESDRRLREWRERNNEKLANNTFSVGLDKAAGTWWDNFNNEAQRGADFFNKTMKGMEDAVVSWARTGKLSAGDFFASMAEDFLREMVKMAEAKAFFNAAGEFGGEGSWVSTAITWASTMMGFANGNPNVTRDGPAYLHEGERVLTRQQNLAYTMGGASGGTGGGVVINDNRTLNVGQGVSLAQVAAVVQRGNDMLEAKLSRRQREGAPA